MTRWGLVARSAAITAIATAVVITGCAPTGHGETDALTPTAPTGRLFTGDYSTGDFSQWPLMATKYYGTPEQLLPGSGYHPDYPATIVDDPVKGKAARFEVRSGDLVGKTESSQVTGTSADTGGTEGQIRWYAFLTKFDPSFPMNHASLGWGLTNQWHDDANTGGSPPFGFYVDELNGNWSLTVQKQSAPTVFLDVYPIWNTPLDRGTWHDIKMEVMFSTSDSSGYIRLWQNGVRQKFLDGNDTYHVRTLTPGTTSVYYKEGYYRQPIAPTGIVFHSGFRSADREDAL
jgi:hypothetical protein